MPIEVGGVYKEDTMFYTNYFKPISELSGSILVCEHLQIGKVGRKAEGVVHKYPSFNVIKFEHHEPCSIEEYNAARELARSMI